MFARWAGKETGQIAFHTIQSGLNTTSTPELLNTSFERPTFFPGCHESFHEVRYG